MIEIEDKDIVEAVRKDAEGGFRLLVQKYKERLYWHIRRLVVAHEDAQDVTQEAFLRIFRSFGQFKGDYSFNAWIYRIATNEAFRLLEKRKKEQLSLDDVESGTPSLMKADSYVNYDSLELKFQRAIQILPEKQRVTFTLRYYDELDYDEIGKITDTNGASAKANYHVAKNKIVQYMNSND